MAKNNDVAQPDEGRYQLHEEDEEIQAGESFSSYIKKYQKTCNKSTRELGDLSGIGYEQIRKIINRSRPTKKRDCIIAICFLLMMDDENTNRALLLYGQMLELDGRYNPRDDLIVYILDDRCEDVDDLMTLHDFNKRLISANFEPLDIINHKSKTAEDSELQRPELPYRVLKTRTASSTETPFTYDATSLGTLYDPDNCHSIGHMLLVDETKESTYTLGADDYGKMWVSAHSKDGEPSFRFLKTIEEVPEFAVYFKNLVRKVATEKSHMNELLADTRNFGKRISAGLNNGRIHIFIEQYNYAMPQANEYYLFEYINGAYRLSISNTSLFMQEYLPADDYLKYYGNKRHEPLYTYNSQAEIDALLEDKKLSFIDRDVLCLRRNTFKKMKVETGECLDNLRTRKVFVRNPAFIEDNAPGWICTFFDVESEFDCTEQGDYKLLEPGRTDAKIFSDNGDPVMVTLDDLQRAFELGFRNINEICYIKALCGSIEGVLQ